MADTTNLIPDVDLTDEIETCEIDTAEFTTEDGQTLKYNRLVIFLKNGEQFVFSLKATNKVVARFTVRGLEK